MSQRNILFKNPREKSRKTLNPHLLILPLIFLLSAQNAKANLPKSLTLTLKIKEDLASEGVLFSSASVSPDGSKVIFCGDTLAGDAVDKFLLSHFDLKTDPSNAKKISELSLGDPLPIEQCSFISNNLFLLKTFQDGKRSIIQAEINQNGDITLGDPLDWKILGESNPYQMRVKFKKGTDFFVLDNTVLQTSYFGLSSTAKSDDLQSTSDINISEFSKIEGNTMIYRAHKTEGFQEWDFTTGQTVQKGTGGRAFKADFGLDYYEIIPALTSGGRNFDRILITMGIEGADNKFMNYYKVTGMELENIGSLANDEKFKNIPGTSLYNFEGSDIFIFTSYEYNKSPGGTTAYNSGLMIADFTEAFEGSILETTAIAVPSEYLGGKENYFVTSIVGLEKGRLLLSGLLGIGDNGVDLTTKGFYLTFDYKVKLCDPSCSTCTEEENAEKCIICKKDRFFEPLEVVDIDLGVRAPIGRCIDIIKSTCGGELILGCVACESGNETFCRSCQRGLGLDELTPRGTGGRCVKCPVNGCSDCEIAVNGNRTCQRCFDGYSMKFEGDGQVCEGFGSLFNLSFIFFVIGYMTLYLS